MVVEVWLPASVYFFELLDFSLVDRVKIIIFMLERVFKSDDWLL